MLIPAGVKKKKSTFDKDNHKNLSMSFGTFSSKKINKRAANSKAEKITPRIGCDICGALLRGFRKVGGKTEQKVKTL